MVILKAVDPSPSTRSWPSSLSWVKSLGFFSLLLRGWLSILKAKAVLSEDLVPQWPTESGKSTDKAKALNKWRPESPAAKARKSRSWAWLKEKSFFALLLSPCHSVSFWTFCGQLFKPLFWLIQGNFDSFLAFLGLLRDFAWNMNKRLSIQAEKY